MSSRLKNWRKYALGQKFGGICPRCVGLQGRKKQDAVHHPRLTKNSVGRGVASQGNKKDAEMIHESTLGIEQNPHIDMRLFPLGHVAPIMSERGGVTRSKAMTILGVMSHYAEVAAMRR